MQNANHHFRIELPPGWTDQSVFSFAGPTENGVAHQLNLSIEPALDRTDARSLAEERFAMIRASLPETRVLKEDRFECEAARDGHEIVYRWKSPAGDTRYGRQVVLFMEGRFFVFNGSFGKATKLTQGKLITKMIESLRYGATV